MIMQHLVYVLFIGITVNTYGYIFRVLSNSLLRGVFKLQNKEVFKKYQIGYDIPKLEDCKYFNPEVYTPIYYKADFHAYTGGNLDPLSAKEVTAASYAVLASHDQDASGYVSSDNIRTRFSYNAKAYFSEKNMFKNGPMRIVDNGCGIGISTRYAEEMYEDTQVNGIDLSPYFLEVGSHSSFKPTTTFCHGLSESSGFVDNSKDMILCSYLHHELPYQASKNMMKEAFRVLDKGGVLCILDMDPDIKGSNPLLEFVFKRTEPYLKEYKKFMSDIEEIAEEIGFEDVLYDSLHKTKMVFLRKPIRS